MVSPGIWVILEELREKQCLQSFLVAFGNWGLVPVFPALSDVAEGPGGINQPTNKSGFHVIDCLCQRVLNVHEVHQEITDSFVVSSDLRLRFI